MFVKIKKTSLKKIFQKKKINKIFSLNKNGTLF
jgi:hypothetical protein